MNWKFWQRPAAVLPLTDPAWPGKLQRLKEQLAVTRPDDPLLAGFLGLIDANVRTELPPSTVPGLPSEEAHRFRGRIGMLLDLKADLEKLHRDCVAQPPTASVRPPG